MDGEELEGDCLWSGLHEGKNKISIVATQTKPNKRDRKIHCAMFSTKPRRKTGNRYLEKYY